MIVFAVAGAVLVAVALAFLLRPLLRTPGGSAVRSAAQANLAVYRQQLNELEADARSGTLSADHYQAARRELERRLLDDVAAAHGEPHAVTRRSPRLALTVGALVPVAAVLLYAGLGSPDALQATPAADAAHDSAHGTDLEQIDVLAARLAVRLESQPDDADGWAMLARTYRVLGRDAEAASAYAKAAELAPGDAQLLADYADALAVSLGRRLEGAPMQLVRRALQLDPRNAKALALAGTAEFDRKRYRAAADYWQRAFDAAADDPEFRASIRESLAEARVLGGRAPTADVDRSQVVALAGGAVPATGVASSVSGKVEIDPELARSLPPTDTVFIFARAADGPRMPLAMLSKQVKDLPMHFVLDDTSSMIPGHKLSDAGQVLVTARVSRTGSAQRQPGDVEGNSSPVAVGAQDLRLTIDTVVR